MNPERSVHVPVMPREVMQSLQLAPGMTVLDGTAGAGGHSALILKSIGSTGTLISTDRDAFMLKLASQKVSGANCHLIQSSYIGAKDILQQLKIESVDRVLLDLGLSSDQLADRERGFGFDAGGPLDMRFNSSEGQPVAELLKTLSEEKLRKIFEDYGEESAAPRIAAEIVRRRQNSTPVETTEDLEDCVAKATGMTRNSGGRNSSTRIFQALRIAVNDELRHVETMLNDVLPAIMSPGGIAVILTFHSLEDRIVKNAFKGHPQWQVLNKTPIEATPAEVRLNPRSRSAKLRAARWQGSC